MDTNRSVQFVFIRVHSRFLFDRLWLRLCCAVPFGASRGILRLRRTIPLFLEEIYFETACVDSYVRKQAHPPRRMSYLARNSGVAANSA
jgi:hypothetical protein